MKLWRNCWLSSGRELGQNRSLLIARNIQQEKAIVDITPQNVMKTVIKYINLFWHGVGRCWRGSEFSRAPPMHGAGLCLLWPLGPTLEFRVWAFLVWTFTCEASLLPGDQLAGLLLLLGTVMQYSHSVMMAVRMF